MRAHQVAAGNDPAVNLMRESPGRARGLDGLRGIAALVVVFHHAFLTRSSLAAPYQSLIPGHIGALAWISTYTPIHLVWDGTEAVYVFFVLSGYVLTLAGTGRSASTLVGWLSYYPRRLVRLYLPALAAVGLAVGWLTLVPRTTSPSASWWLNNHVRSPSLSDIVRDASLVKGTAFTNSALWSLQWEVVFSLLLPLFILFAMRVQGLAWLKLGALLSLTALGTYRQSLAMEYLPMFGVGSVLAAEQYRLRQAFERLQRTRHARAVSWALVLSTLLLLNSYWTVLSRTPIGRTALYEIAAARALAVAGAALAVVLVAHNPMTRAPFERGPVQWLGLRSFSLYLVHEPVVVSIALILGATAPLWLTLALAVPIALLLAEVFYWLIERPSIRLSHRVGLSVGTTLTRNRRTAAAHARKSAASALH